MNRPSKLHARNEMSAPSQEPVCAEAERDNRKVMAGSILQSADRNIMRRRCSNEQACQNGITQSIMGLKLYQSIVQVRTMLIYL